MASMLAPLAWMQAVQRLGPSRTTLFFNLLPLITALIAAVEQLPLEQHEAFLLQAEGDLSVQEIAEATGVNFETAKSRLRYARASLRQHLCLPSLYRRHVEIVHQAAEQPVPV